MNPTESPNARDILQSRGATAAFYGLPVLAIVRLTRTGWSLLSGALIVATLVAYYVIEPALGRYRRA